MNLDFLFNRQSVRKFKEDAVPTCDIKEIIKAASVAPSAKNVQNWHFVAVTQKDMIDKIAKAVEDKNASLAENITDEKMKTNFTKFLRFSTFFKNAPCVILVFTEDSYIPTGLDVLENINASNEDIELLKRANPAIQSIGSAIENLITAATAMDYGTCWMTSQNYAGKEIAKAVDFSKDGYFLAATIPVGRLEGEAKSPKKKELDEILTII